MVMGDNKREILNIKNFSRKIPSVGPIPFGNEDIHMLHGEQYFGNLTALTSNQWRRDNNKIKNETLNRKYVTIFLLKGRMVLRVDFLEGIKQMIFDMMYALSFAYFLFFELKGSFKGIPSSIKL